MPLEGRCLYYALLGLTQAPGFAGGHDYFPDKTYKNAVNSTIIEWELASLKASLAFVD